MDLKKHVPELDGKFGAPMGRAFRNEQSYAAHGSPFLYRDGVRDPDFEGDVSLRRILLLQGYDQGGAYWGDGDPLFSAMSEDGRVDMTMRAKTRAEAEAQVLAAHPKATFARDDAEFDDFRDGYVTAMLFSTNDDEGDPLDSADHTLSDELDEMIDADCRAFLDSFGDTIRACASTHTPGSSGDSAFAHAGRDFWFTRAGHGCGFWDGNWPDEAGKALTAGAKAVGNIDVHEGDDGKLHA